MFDNSTQQRPCKGKRSRKYPEIQPNYESTTVPRLFFGGFCCSFTLFQFPHPAWVPLASLGGGVPPSSPNPDSISEQKKKCHFPHQFSDLAPVVLTLDSAIHRINHYPADKYYEKQWCYLLDSDLSKGQRYPTLKQPEPGARFSKVPVTFRARNQIFKSKYKE